MNPAELGELKGQYVYWWQQKQIDEQSYTVARNIAKIPELAKAKAQIIQRAAANVLYSQEQEWLFGNKLRNLGIDPDEVQVYGLRRARQEQEELRKEIEKGHPWWKFWRLV